MNDDDSIGVINGLGWCDAAVEHAFEAGVIHVESEQEKIEKKIDEKNNTNEETKLKRMAK